MGGHLTILPRQGEVSRGNEVGGHGTYVSHASPSVWQGPATSPWRGRILVMGVGTAALFVIPAKAGTSRHRGTPLLLRHPGLGPGSTVPHAHDYRIRGTVDAGTSPA